MIQATSRGRWTNRLLSLVSRQARRELRQSRPLKNANDFLREYRKLAEQRFSQRQRSDQVVAGGLEAAVQEGCNALRSDGIYVWRGLFGQSDWLHQARQEMANVVGRWELLFSQSGSTEKSHGDSQTEPVFYRGRREIDGRLRATYARVDFAPPSFQRVMRHAGLKELVSRYFDRDAECTYLLAERLTQADRGDWWHVDRIVDQVKMMVLLTDLDESQGPLRFKAGTHLYQAKLEPIYYSVYSHGVDYAYPPGPTRRGARWGCCFGSRQGG